MGSDGSLERVDIYLSRVVPHISRFLSLALCHSLHYNWLHYYWLHATCYSQGFRDSGEAAEVLQQIESQGRWHRATLGMLLRQLGSQDRENPHLSS